MSESSPIKDALYANIDDVGQERIHKLMLNGKFAELFEKIFETSINSLDSGSDRLTQAIDRVGSIDWEFDSRAFSRKTVVLDEIDRQNIRGGWKSETNALRYLQNWNDSNLLMID